MKTLAGMAIGASLALLVSGNILTGVVVFALASILLKGE